MYHFLHPSSSLVLSILMLLSIGSVQCFASTTIMPSHSIRAKEKAIDRFSSPFLNAKTVKMAKSMPMVTALRGGALIHDTAISAMVVCESLIWLKIWTTLASKGILESKLTRKIIHSGSAPLFMAHWPLYTSPMARALAVAVPLLQVGRLYQAGTGIGSPKRQNSSSESGSTGNGSNNDNMDGEQSELVKAVSRTGSKAEALGGPLIYSIVLCAFTFAFFRESPVGVVAISQMAAGDGFADIFGRRFGSIKWPFSKTKSVVGTLAFVLGGFLVSAALLALFNYTGCLSINVIDKAPMLLLISVISATVELYPIVDDNISVPLAAALATYMLL